MVPWKDWQQICEKEDAYNLEIYEHSRESCIEHSLFSALKKKKKKKLTT